MTLRTPLPMYPKPYDLSDPDEMDRLFYELREYMKVSLTHGSDREGRRYALDALVALTTHERKQPASAQPSKPEYDAEGLWRLLETGGYLDLDDGRDYAKWHDNFIALIGAIQASAQPQPEEAA